MVRSENICEIKMLQNVEMFPDDGQVREDTGAAVRRDVDFSRTSRLPRGKTSRYQNS